MNCKTIQRRLLGSRNPDRVSASVREHLAACPACLAVQQRIAQIEKTIPLMKVPSSSFAKAATMRRIRTGPTVRETVAGYAARVPDRLRSMGRLKLSAIGMAAAVLLMVFGWKMLSGPGPGNVNPGPQGPSRDALLASLFQRNLSLAKVGTPAPQQVESLAAIADDLHGGARSISRAANAGESVQQIAVLYEKVLVVEVKRAGKLPRDKNRDVLNQLSQRLDRAAQQADALAVEITAPDDHPLRVMAQSARKAKEDLAAGTQSSQRIEPTPKSAVASQTMPGWSRWLLTPLYGVSAAARAEGSAATTPTEEAKRFQRNYRVIKAVVEGSLQLAEQEDPIARARSYQQLAVSLVDEIRQAAAEREGARVEEMSQHLRSMVTEGVTPNVRTANERIPKGSQEERSIVDVASELVRVAQPLQDQLERSTDPQTQDYLRTTLKAIADSRGGVDRIMQDRGLKIETGFQPRLEANP